MSEQLALQARDVEFDLSQTAWPWIPGRPVASHVVDVLHVMLPAGERYFVRLFTEALPLVTDPALAEQVRGFIGQESLHARSHDVGAEYLRAHGLDPDPAVAPFVWLFDEVFGDRGLTGRRRRAWLMEQLAVVAAIEHFTAVLGEWILSADSLDDLGADPTVLDMLRWHGAEEVEHRSVAYDLWVHLDGSYRRRAAALVWVAAMLPLLWYRSAGYLVRADPALSGMTRRRVAWELARAGRTLPSIPSLLAQLPVYLAPSYHPSHHGSTQAAAAYLGRSPATLAADARHAA